ncbi:MAG: hypothetical protein KAI47_21070 [Deltaproteobacteria bacterium]|nr:hypothetical protein [Deltaproteobacteria bacterium]
MISDHAVPDANLGPFVTVEKGEFHLGDRKWVPVGVNYWPTFAQPFYRDEKYDWVTMALDGTWEGTMMDFSCQGDCKALIDKWIEADLDLMKEHGINEVRLPPSWVYLSPEKEIDPNRSLDGELSDINTYCYRLNYFLDRALEHDIRVTLIIPNRRHWYNDPHVFQIAADKAEAEKFVAYTIKLIDQCGLAKHRGIFSYTLGVEDSVEYCSCAYEKRTRKDCRNIASAEAIALWNEWIIERYGSVDHAETRWETHLDKACVDKTCPLDSTACKEKHATLRCPPRDAKLNLGGSMALAVKAFRRFVATAINKRQQRLTSLIRAHDPHHLITQDSALEDGWCNYCFSYISRATTKYLDFSSPHIYHIADPSFRANLEDFSKIDMRKSLRGTAASLAYLEPERRPVVIGEFGCEAKTCKNSAFKDQTSCKAEDLPALQSKYYAFETEIFRAGGASGQRWWWWMGSRPMTGDDHEESDFGLFNLAQKIPPTVSSTDARPLLTDNRITDAVTAYQSSMLAAETITYNPLDSVCLNGILNTEIKEKAQIAVEEGKRVVLEHQCTAKDSTNVPLLCVDSKPDGTKTYWVDCDPNKQPCCALLCLDALFDKIEVRVGVGAWQIVEDGDTVHGAKGSSIFFRVIVGNTGESAWNSQGIDEGEKKGVGQVKIRVLGGDTSGGRVPIGEDVASFASTPPMEFEVLKSLNTSTRISLNMVAGHRAMFGETVKLDLVLQ